MSRPAITVIIPTTCEAKRELVIRRAVKSVLTQSGVDVQLLIVANGARFDQRIIDELRAYPRIAVHMLGEPSYPAACRHGRSLVATEFFAYLDDDDEFLPGALFTRVTPLLEDATVDFVATNGYLSSGGRETLAYDPSAKIEQEPLEELLRANWMQPCGNLFRGATVTLDYFDGTTKYYEWTLLAFRLSQKLTLRFIDIPTYRKHDTAESLYKSAGVVEGAIVVIDMLIAYNTKDSLRGTLARLRGAALHATSDVHRQAGHYARAWKFHLSSLRYPRGWRYLPYTRRLLLPVTRADASAST
jgi:glycosyltransferase involved in cell wall biosynthesis